MLKIGITGGIGTGKTTVCKIFQSLGIPVFYADEQAKALMNTDAKLIQQIKDRFGEETYDSSNQLNRARLASLVFTDEKALKELNSFVHPATFQAFKEWQKGKEAPYCLHEAAILFESGAFKTCDYIVLVSSPLELRMKRIKNRDNKSVAEIQAIMDKQLPEEEKAERSDFILINDEKKALIPQVLKLHQELLKR